MGKYFGTDGFRGEANCTLTADHAFKVGRFLGWYYTQLKHRAGFDEPAKIIIGKDTRRSSYMFEYSLVGGLVASGADAYLLHVKTNHASSDVIVVKSKKTLSDEKIKAIRRKLRHALNHSYELVQGFEMQYKGIPPLIIAERLIQDEKYNELRDYKFLCFDGVPYYCWVDCDRYTNHTRNVYDMEWNLMPWTQGGYKNSSVSVEKPENFDTMVEVAKKLSADFSHVRVDLYNVEGKIYFGEMTFTNGSGFEKLPDRINYELGCLWKLSC